MAKIIDPVSRLAAITPSDTAENYASAIYVGGAGDIAITALADSAAVTLVGVPAGTVLPIRAQKIMATNTTATNIVALK